MLQVRGNCNTAKIFNDHLEEGAEEQIRLLCDQAFAAGSQIRIMPDVHAGKGCTIGTTMTITDKVVPNLVGVDIGCGMETVRLAEETLDLEALDQVIRQRIPAGFSIRQTLIHTMKPSTSRRCAVPNESIWAEPAAPSAPWAAATILSRWIRMRTARCT